MTRKQAAFAVSETRQARQRQRPDHPLGMAAARCVASSSTTRAARC
jgi:hypothetical protein